MAHENTILSQMLKYIPRHGFQSCVRKHDGDKRVRSMNCWTQLIAMLFGHVTQRKSLRDIESSWASAASFRYHSGMGSVKRSTLADANESRSHQIFADYFASLYGHVASLASKKMFKIKAPIALFDGTVIDLCLSLFPWAKYQRKKSAIKLHTVYDLNSKLPSCVTVTDANTYELEVARQLDFAPGSIVVFDRGLTDFNWYHQLNERGYFFITRLKRKANFRVMTNRKQSSDLNILADQTIEFVGIKTSLKYPLPLRRIEFKDPETGKHLEFLTNAFHLSASTIAKLYKARWQVELFFKWIKQNLKIKSFLGTSENAVKIQIWTALIAFLLIAYLKHLSKSSLSMLEIMRLIQTNIFRKLRLIDLLHKHFKTFKPPDVLNQFCFQQLLTGQ
jgi:hypothetical protein